MNTKTPEICNSFPSDPMFLNHDTPEEALAKIDAKDWLVSVEELDAAEALLPSPVDSVEIMQAVSLALAGAIGGGRKEARIEFLRNISEEAKESGASFKVSNMDVTCVPSWGRVFIAYRDMSDDGAYEIAATAASTHLSKFITGKGYRANTLNTPNHHSIKIEL